MRTRNAGTLFTALFTLAIAVELLLPTKSAAAASLYVVDPSNNRILRFSPPFANGMSANAVLGQTSFTNSSAGLGPDVFDFPGGIDHDMAGNLFVADGFNNRVLEFQQPITTGESASLVIGQPDFTSNTAGTAINQLRNPGVVLIDRRGTGALFVVIPAHVRMFSLPFSNGMNATLQLGNNGSIPQTIAPTGLAINNKGLFVSDLGYSRVLEYTIPLVRNQLATLVLGADGFDHRGQGIAAPWGSAFDSRGDLWVVDEGANRVLEFVPPFWNDKAPSLVIGQPDFKSRATQLSQSGLDNPQFIAFDDRGNLWVADTSNNRVLEFVPPFSNGMNASVVIGQPDFVSNGVGTSARQIFGPFGITFAP